MSALTYRISTAFEPAEFPTRFGCLLREISTDGERTDGDVVEGVARLVDGTLDLAGSAPDLEEALRKEAKLHSTNGYVVAWCVQEQCISPWEGDPDYWDSDG